MRGARGAVPLLGLILGVGVVAGHVQIWFCAIPLLLAVLGFSVLAGHGAAGWEKGLRRRRILTAVGVVGGAALLALTVLALWVVSNVAGDELRGRVASTCLPAVLRGMAGLAIVVAGLVLVRLAPRAIPVLPGAFLVAVLLTGIPPIETVRSDFYFHDYSRLLPVDTRDHRIYVFRERFPNLERQGVRGLRLMANAGVPWYLETVRTGSKDLLYWFDVRLDLEATPRDRLLSGPPFPVLKVRDLHPACGRAVLFDGARSAGGDEEVRSALLAGARTLLLHGPGSGAADDGPGSPVREPARAVLLPDRDPNRLTFRVTAPGDSWLYVSEKYYPHWRAKVDGEPVTIHRANLTGLALRVPGGEHRVDLESTTSARTLGLPVSLTTLVVCVAALVAALLRRRGSAGTITG